MMEINSFARSLNEAADNYFRHTDECSLQKVIESAEGLIKYFARLYGGGCCEDDLFQTGRLGQTGFDEGLDEL